MGVPRSRSAAGESEGPLSPLIHGRVRLLVLARLVAEDRPIPFTELRDRLALTDGTLSVHLRRLETAGIITLEKRFVARRPQTLVHITDAGRAAFTEYIAELKEIVPGLAD